MYTSESLLNEILLLCITKEDVDEIRSIIASIRSEIYKDTPKLPDMYLSIPKEYQATFSILLKDFKGTSASSTATSELVRYDMLLSDIDTALSKRDFMRLVVAFKPSRHFLISLRNIFNGMTHNSVLFDVKNDPDIIGGMEIDYLGRHVDMSLNTMINTYFVEHKDAFLSSI
jgi:hypothetical protein